MMAPPLPRIDVQAHDLQVGGRRLRCRTLVPEGATGLADGPVLVFLHEALGCSLQWGRFPEELSRATGLPALLYDRYGHGESEPLAAPRSPDYLETEAFAVLPRVLEAFGIGQPVPLGHSDGASIALLFAARFPEAPRALLGEAPHVFVEETTLRGVRQADRAFAQGPLRERLLPLHGGGLDALFRGWRDAWLAPQRRGWDITPCLGAIRAPLLLVQGEEDEYGSPAQIEAVRTRTSGPAETFLVPGCGHVPHHQARAQVAERMAGFLGRALAAGQAV